MEDLKEKSTLRIHSGYLESRSKGDKEFRAREYYVSVIGNITEDAIKKYIRGRAEESKKEDSRSITL